MNRLWAVFVVVSLIVAAFLCLYVDHRSAIERSKHVLPPAYCVKTVSWMIDEPQCPPQPWHYGRKRLI